MVSSEYLRGGLWSPYSPSSSRVTSANYSTENMQGMQDFDANDYGGIPTANSAAASGWGATGNSSSSSNNGSPYGVNDSSLSSGGSSNSGDDGPGVFGRIMYALSNTQLMRGAEQAFGENKNWLSALAYWGDVVADTLGQPKIGDTIASIGQVLDFTNSEAVRNSPNPGALMWGAWGQVAASVANLFIRS